MKTSELKEGFNPRGLPKGEPPKGLDLPSGMVWREGKHEDDPVVCLHDKEHDTYVVFYGKFTKPLIRYGVRTLLRLREV